MLKMIFHQLWNQRKQNGWIFLELLVVSFFLWTVIDPVYVLIANRLIDPGYKSEGAYVVRFQGYMPNDAKYNAEVDDDSIGVANYWHIARIISNQPEVESYSISKVFAFPHSTGWVEIRLQADTASTDKTEGKVSAQLYRFVAAEGSDMFKTYGMRDALTGGTLKLPEDVRGKVFISQRAACMLFGTADNAVGKKVYEENNKSLEVAGVFRDYKHFDFEQPYPLMVLMDKTLENGRYVVWNYAFVIRLKKGVDGDAFKKRFREEVAPNLSLGNYYLGDLQTCKELSDSYAASSGVTNKLRLQYVLTGFAVFCIFLGMLGTFWIRCDARRQEIGVMRSMGASMGDICRQFLLEAWMLVTMATFVTLPLLLHHARINGMYVLDVFHKSVPNPAYWQNQFFPHFFIVLLVSYVLLLLVALVGTYVPVNRAIRTLPAEALRDE